jgi:tellurite resistance protein TerC
MNFSEFISISLFLIVLALLLLFDLGLFNKKEKEPSFTESLIRTGIWVFLALIFCVYLWFNGSILHGISRPEDLRALQIRFSESTKAYPGNFIQDIKQFNHNMALSFLNGYLVEYSLSMDNILVMILIFTSFKVERKYYHQVLFWGIIGAVFMRAIFIFLGTSLIQNFHWVLYIFGAFLIFSGSSMFLKRNEEETIETESHPMVKMLSRIFPLEPRFHGNRFFLRQRGKISLTPLFIVLMVIEFSDLIFAVDSIPAVFSITRDPYIVFFSNIFAIMGLRSLFFLMEGIVDRFHYLKTGLAILLVLIGLKMVFPSFFERIGFNNMVSLILILGILSGSILLSLWVTGRRNKKEINE